MKEELKREIDNLSSSEEEEELVKWLLKKINLSKSGKTIDIPNIFLPIIDQYEYDNKIDKDLKLKVDSYYYQTKKDKKGVIYYPHKEKNMSQPDKLELLNKLVFKPKKVVWVEFGINIQDEFSGRHPAVILQNAGKNLVVVPLSSQCPGEIKNYHVVVDKLYGKFPRYTRWINIQRAKLVSKHRVVYTNHGEIHKDSWKEIKEAIKTTYNI